TPGLARNCGSPPPMGMLRSSPWAGPRRPGSAGRMDLTIIWGGTAGLARPHERAPDRHVRVLAASSGRRGGGSMIDFFGPGFGAAERMGVIEELRSRGHVFEGVRYGTPDGTETGRIDAGPLIDAAGGRCFSILRPEVELGLLAALPGNV